MAARKNANKASDARVRQRAMILDTVYDMARSGQHKGHISILRELEVLKGFLGGISAARTWLEDPTVRAQLDKLCAMAQSGQERPVEAPPHTSTRA